MGVITLNEKDLLAGMTSGIKTYEMDKQNKTVTVIFNNGTSTTIQVNTSVAKIERVLEAYLTNDTTLVKNDEFNSKVAAYVKDDTTVVKTSEFDSKVNAYLAEKVYPVLENETGVTNAEYEYGDVRRYGAVGDGETDDTEALRAAFTNAKAYPKTVIKLEKNKTYILRNTANLGQYSLLEGNGATILIDKMPVSDTGIQVFWDNGYGGNIKLFDWENVNIDFSPELIVKTDNTTKIMWLFNMCDCEEFRMKNVNIISNGDERNHVNLFTFYGHGKIFLDDCNFKNTMRGREDGSILWIQSKLADGYYVRVNRCKFYCNTWDEIISCYNAGTHDIVIDGCTIEKYWYDTYYDKNQELNQSFSGYFLTNNYLGSSTTFTEEEISEIYHNVTYQNCKLVCKPINPDSSIGILGMTAFGNVYAVPSTLKFINCDIDIANIRQIAQGDSKNNFESNIEWCDNSNVIFDNCNIKLTNFIGKRGLVRSDSTNVAFQNCKMTLDSYLCNQTWVESNKCTCFQLAMLNNKILINNANTTLFVVNPLAKETYKIIGNDIIATDSTGTYVDVVLLKESTSANGYDSESVVFYHSDNAKYNFYAAGNRINYIDMDLEKPNYYSCVADMQADTTLKAGKKCITLGYYSPNDGGRSTYLIRAKADEDTDDGGSIIVIGDVVAELIIENNTLSTKQFGAKADGEADDFLQMQCLYRYVNKYDGYLNVTFDGTKMLLSDRLIFMKSNLRIDLHCDISLTKTTFDATTTMDVFRIGLYELITDVYFYGHGHTIDGNGSAVDFTENATTLPNSAEGIEMRCVYRGGIYDVHVNNALANGILIQFSKDIVVRNCVTSNTVVNNGLTVMEFPIKYGNGATFLESDDTYHSNILIDSCESYGNKDLGFTTGWAINVKFVNCYSHDNGNIDGFNAGGGYSQESFNWLTTIPERYSKIGVKSAFDTKVTFENCRAINNNNFGFYADKVDTVIKNCLIDGVINTVTENTLDSQKDRRKGNGIFCTVVKDGFTIDGCTVKNCDNYAILLRNTTGKAYIKDTVINSLKGIYMYSIANYVLDNLRFENATTPMYFEGTLSETAIVKKLIAINCGAVRFGNTNLLSITDVYAKLIESESVDATTVYIDNTNYGFIKNSIMDKGTNTVSKIGLKLAKTVDNAFVASEADNIFITDTAICDLRSTTTTTE